MERSVPAFSHFRHIDEDTLDPPAPTQKTSRMSERHERCQVRAGYAFYSQTAEL